MGKGGAHLGGKWKIEWHTGVVNERWRAHLGGMWKIEKARWGGE